MLNLHKYAAMVVGAVVSFIVLSIMNTLFYFQRKVSYLLGLMMFLFGINAHAAVPAGVSTAITDAATDVATIGAAVILVYVGIRVFKWIRGAL